MFEMKRKSLGHHPCVASAVIGGAAVLGYMSSQNSADAATSAADTQAAAANRAADLQNAQWQQTQANLKPYMDLGKNAINPMMAAMGYNSDGSVNKGNPLQQTFTAPTAAQAQQTPGYQFTLDQGLQAVQNSASARGLGTSGAAMKGAAQYASGLADSTYNDVYNRALQTFQTNYNTASNNANRLSGLVSNGQNAAATNGSLGAASANSIGNSLTSGANALASGTVGSANAWSSGVSGIGNNAMLYAMMNNNAGSAGAGSSANSAAAGNWMMGVNGAAG